MNSRFSGVIYINTAQGGRGVFVYFITNSNNISKLQPHESIGMYTLVFHKEHKNADNMKLNEDQFSARELERHRGSKFVWVQFYFHH